MKTTPEPHDDVDAVTDLYLAHREALPSDRAYSVLTVSRASDALVRLLRDETDPRVVAAALHAYHDDADVAARCCDALAAGVALTTSMPSESSSSAGSTPSYALPRGLAGRRSDAGRLLPSAAVVRS